MKLGLIANVKRTGAHEAIDFFINWAKTSGNELLLCDELATIGYKNNLTAREKISEKVDILVSMGGDGTFLASARAVGNSGTPILGINLGSLGFLTQLTPHQLLPALDAVVQGDYSIQKRMLLKVETDDPAGISSPYALNDVVIDNGSVSRLIDINLSVNKEEIVTYKADGLIIATPTGSTAYALAAGGPIMHPKMEAMIAAPVAAFSLNTRPMIFSANDTLEIKILTKDHPAIVTLDGQISQPLGSISTITVSKADFYINYIVFADSSFYKVLSNKLHWGYTPFTN